MTSRVVKLTVITDFACANCFVIEHELLEAILTCKETLELPLAFELEHIPYKLVGSEAFQGDSKLTREEFLTKQFGKEKFTKIEAAISKWAEEKSIPISFDGVMSPTIKAHRLCQKAYRIGGQDLQLPILLAVFKAYLSESKDIADIDILADLADQNDVMSKQEAVAFLESDELETEVSQMCDKARAKGFTGVPVIIIDGKWAVKGGQSSDVFVQIFKKLACCGGGGAGSNGNSSCTPVIDTLTA